MKTQTKDQAIEKAIKRVNSPYYDADRFRSDAKQWIKAINEGRMFCRVHRVSASGMSRVFSYHSWEKYEKPINGGQRGTYRQYYSFLQALGHSMTDAGIRVSGCGMDMNFHTCYNIAHRLCAMGLLKKSELYKFAQKTPVIL